MIIAVLINSTASLARRSRSSQDTRVGHSRQSPTDEIGRRPTDDNYYEWFEELIQSTELYSRGRWSCPIAELSCACCCAWFRSGVNNPRGSAYRDACDKYHRVQGVWASYEWACDRCTVVRQVQVVGGWMCAARKSIASLMRRKSGGRSMDALESGDDSSGAMFKSIYNINKMLPSNMSHSNIDEDESAGLARVLDPKIDAFICNYPVRASCPCCCAFFYTGVPVPRNLDVGVFRLECGDIEDGKGMWRGCHCDKIEKAAIGYGFSCAREDMRHG